MNPVVPTANANAETAAVTGRDFEHAISRTEEPWGAYTWHFKQMPPGVPTDDCLRIDGLKLLLCGNLRRNVARPQPTGQQEWTNESGSPGKLSRTVRLRAAQVQDGNCMADEPQSKRSLATRPASILTCIGIMLNWKWKLRTPRDLQICVERPCNSVTGRRCPTPF